MSRLIEELERMDQRDSKVRAVLRRSLAFDPGCFPPAYPYVEPFLKDDDNGWKREMHYLVAGLWAMHKRDGRIGEPISIGTACAEVDSEKRMKMSREDRKKMTSTEHRFVILLDADRDQLPYRLRQIVSLLKDVNLDFGTMLSGLVNWNNDQKRIQNQWARDYYRKIGADDTTSNNTAEEEKNEKPD
jgi:CRISPR system Cascade subunit CasB